MKVILFPVNEDPRLIEIESDFKSMQAVVGGLIEMVEVAEGLDVVINEESKINGMLPNRIWMVDGELADIFFGDFFVCSVNDDGESIGLTDEEVSKTLTIFEGTRVS